MVNWTIEAVYRNGVFRPLTPIALPENTCVTLVLHGEGMPGAAVLAPFGEMDETEWTWVSWAGSLGMPDKLPGLEQDEG
jgi:hypothetical protein